MFAAVMSMTYILFPSFMSWLKQVEFDSRSSFHFVVSCDLLQALLDPVGAMSSIPDPSTLGTNLLSSMKQITVKGGRLWFPI